MNKIKEAIDTVDKLYILEENKYADYQNDYEEFKDDIPKLEKTMEMFINVKKYLNNVGEDILEWVGI